MRDYVLGGFGLECAHARKSSPAPTRPHARPLAAAGASHSARAPQVQAYLNSSASAKRRSSSMSVMVGLRWSLNAASVVWVT